MKCYTIHLIRHGQTDANTEGRYAGVTDISLNASGRKELEELSREGLYPEVDMVYSSPLKRCIETAEIIYDGLPINTVANLSELNFGEFENKTAAELESNQNYLDFIGGRLSQIPGGEDLTKFTERIVLGFNEVVRHLSQSGYTDAAVIMHGGVIMSLLGACAFPRRSQLEWQSDNGCGYTVLITPSLYAKSGVFEVIAQLRP